MVCQKIFIDKFTFNNSVFKSLNLNQQHIYMEFLKTTMFSKYKFFTK